MFDLILGIETLAKFGTILDFQERTIQIDHAIVAMRPYTSIARKSNMRVKAFQTDDTYRPLSTGTFARNHPEPISTWDATKCTIEILDANVLTSIVASISALRKGHRVRFLVWTPQH